MAKRYTDLESERKVLFSKLQDVRGNIRVFCRVRPLTVEEARRGEEFVVSFPTPQSVSVPPLDRAGATPKKFTFDHVFTPTSTQDEVYNEIVPLIVSVLDGYNVGILAFGQTGSGKTYTLEGPAHDRGISFRALTELFFVSNQRQQTGEYEYNMSVSLLEIYNDRIFDLLDVGDCERFTIQRGPNGNIIPGLHEVGVKSREEVAKVLLEGYRNRSRRTADLNEHSARAHAVFQINIQSRNKLSGRTAFARLVLVDLAGSERLKHSGLSGPALEEAISIQRSLTALGDVMAARNARSSQVPFRDSRLTHLLQDVFEGDGKVVLYTQISPTRTNIPDSVATLSFGVDARVS